MKDFHAFISEARGSSNPPKTLADIKVGDIFYQYRGQGDSMPEFFVVKSLGNVQEFPQSGGGSYWEGVRTMTVTLVPLEAKLKPTASKMAGTAVPNLKKPQMVGLTNIATAEEHPVDTKGTLVILKITKGRGAPLATKWDGKPVPYTAWG